MVAGRAFDCLICGTALRFEPGSASTHCAMCDEDRPLPLRIDEAVPAVGVGGPIPAPDFGAQSLVRCRGCFAQMWATGPPTTCPICGADAVRSSGGPNFTAYQGYLPFVIDAPTAAARMQTELLRVGLDEAVQLRQVYVPWTLASFRVRAPYRGQRGIQVDDGDGGSYTDWIDIDGTAERDWDHVRECASVGLPAEVARRLAPWDWAFAEPYEPAAIGDVPAEYTFIAVGDVIDRMCPDLARDVRRVVSDDIGGDLTRVIDFEYARCNERVRFILVPVWAGRVRASIAVAVNGRTGEAVVEGHAGGRVEEADMELVPDTGRTGRLIFMYVIFGAVIGAMFWLALS